MKYLQACLLKKQLDGLIEKLMKNLMGVNLNNVVRMRLEVANVSALATKVLTSANMDVGQHVGARGTGQCN